MAVINTRRWAAILHPDKAKPNSADPRKVERRVGLILNIIIQHARVCEFTIVPPALSSIVQLSESVQQCSRSRYIIDACLSFHNNPPSFSISPVYLNGSRLFNCLIIAGIGQFPAGVTEYENEKWFISSRHSSLVVKDCVG